MATLIQDSKDPRKYTIKCINESFTADHVYGNYRSDKTLLVVTTDGTRVFDCTGELIGFPGIAAPLGTFVFYQENNSVVRLCTKTGRVKKIYNFQFDSEFSIDALSINTDLIVLRNSEYLCIITVEGKQVLQTFADHIQEELGCILIYHKNIVSMFSVLDRKIMWTSENILTGIGIRIVDKYSVSVTSGFCKDNNGCIIKIEEVYRCTNSELQKSKVVKTIAK